MLKDEHQALQMLHSSLEEKMKKLQEDNMQLVSNQIYLQSYVSLSLSIRSLETYFYDFLCLVIALVNHFHKT